MHVLVAVDDSEPARAALRFALEDHPDADVTVLHVVDPSGSAYGEYAHVAFDDLVEQKRTEGKQLLETMLEDAPDHAGTVTTETTVGRPATRIVAYAEEHDVDHIIVGSQGRSGVSRVLLGSVAELVARRASVPVTIVR